MFMATQYTGFNRQPNDPVLTFLQAAVDGTNTATPTFASQNFGTASSDRVLIAVFGTPNTTLTHNSVTIGGVSATLAVSVTAAATPSGGIVSIWIARVPTGTTGTVALTLSGSGVRCGHALYATTGLNSLTPTATSTHNAAVAAVTSGTIAGLGNGVVIGGAYSIDDLAGFTWTGLTENADTFVEGGTDDRFTSASTTLVVNNSSLAWSAATGGAATRSPFGAVAAFR